MTGYGSAVADATLRFVSPSQIKTAQLCQLKWWWEKVQKKKTPTTKSQALGTALHAEWEGHLKQGTPLSPMAFAGKGQEPQGELLVEHCIATWQGGEIKSPVTADDTPVIGFIDILHRPGVVDLKTLSDARWAKTPFEISEDPQMACYGLYHHDHYKHTGPVELTQWYFKTTATYRSWQVAITVSRDRLLEAWEPVHKTVRALKPLPLIPLENVYDVPANTEACKSYGGCPHLSYCPAGAKARLTAWFGTPPALDQPTKEEIDVPKFPKLSPAAAAVMRQLKAQEQPDAARAKHLYDAIGQRKFGLPPLEGEVAQLVFGVPEKEGTQTLAQIAPLTTLDDLLAVARDVDVPENVRAWVPPVPTESPAPAPAPAPAARTEVLEVVVEPPLEPPAEPTLVPPDLPKRPVGRPRKVEVSTAGVATEAAAAVQSPVPAPGKIQPHPLQAGTPTSVAAHTSPFALYINAMPLTKEAKPLYPYILQIIDAVNKAAKVPDVRLADKGSQLAYGGWRGAFSAAVVMSPPVPGVYFIDTMGDEIADVIAHGLIPVVETAGGIVVKGFR